MKLAFKTIPIGAALLFLHSGGITPAADADHAFSGEKKLNNLVSRLLEVTSNVGTTRPWTFNRSADGWIVVSSAGSGSFRVMLDDESDPIIIHDQENRTRHEAMRHVSKGPHKVRVAGQTAFKLETLRIHAIPELFHCGLGFNSQLKGYGTYDMDFLRRDILPNVTTLIVPHNINLPDSVVSDWHRQGKKFVAEVGINSQNNSANEHAKYWTSLFDKTAFLDGIIINEFIVNRPVIEWAALTPERLTRMEKEREQYDAYGEALKIIRDDARYRSKMIYGYVGGSGKKLNQEIIGTNFVRTIMDCGYQVALERYLHEMSSERSSKEALELFVDGLADWEAKEPGVKKQMVIAFGLFSMPPGTINKQPNVDYHVWMDQQMNTVANHPKLSGLAGLNWWTSLLADEETVRFVGRLYRHYAIEGKSTMLTKDPLFLSHIQNADFENATNGWTLQPAEDGAIIARSFPRYGRIEGRYMGLGRPPDPEHIGDTFLCLRKSAKGPNKVSQAVRSLEPGRLYSLKMLSCEYEDLVNPKARKVEEIQSRLTIELEGVEVDAKRSFIEVYASSPEPKIPVCITYYWKVFRAQADSARIMISDGDSVLPPGREQAINFLEIQPYWE